MKYVKSERGLPPELCTMAARRAFDYAGEDPDRTSVRWLGTNNEPSDPFTRHDFADLFGVVEYVEEEEYKPEGLPYRMRVFQALGALKDGRVALVEAVSRGGWASSSGVAKVTKLIVQMGDYLARSERMTSNPLQRDPVHVGRAKLCEALRLRLETSTIKAAAEEADAAFDEVERLLGDGA